MQKAADVIGDRRDGEPLHRLLQPQLRARTGIHGLEQIAVLALQLDIDTCAQKLRGAGELAGEVGLALLGRQAGAYCS